MFLPSWLPTAVLLHPASPSRRGSWSTTSRAISCSRKRWRRMTPTREPSDDRAEPQASVAARRRESVGRAGPAGAAANGVGRVRRAIQVDRAPSRDETPLPRAPRGGVQRPRGGGGGGLAERFARIGARVLFVRVLRIPVAREQHEGAREEEQ